MIYEALYSQWQEPAPISEVVSPNLHVAVAQTTAPGGAITVRAAVTNRSTMPARIISASLCVPSTMACSGPPLTTPAQMTPTTLLPSETLQIVILADEATAATARPGQPCEIPVHGSDISRVLGVGSFPVVPCDARSTVAQVSLVVEFNGRMMRVGTPLTRNDKLARTPLRLLPAGPLKPFVTSQVQVAVMNPMTASCTLSMTLKGGARIALVHSALPIPLLGPGEETVIDVPVVPLAGQGVHMPRIQLVHNDTVLYELADIELN